MKTLTKIDAKITPYINILHKNPQDAKGNFITCNPLHIINDASIRALKKVV